MRLSRRVADELADRILAHAASEIGLTKSLAIDWERYHAFYDRVRACFHVPETSITPLMARVLYGIAATTQPSRILVAGVYVGNAMVWLTGPGFGPFALYKGVDALGVDTSGAAIDLARANFAGLGATSAVAFLRDDARSTSCAFSRPWDLVFLDAEDPADGKAIYSDLLARYLPHIPPGGLLLAHDMCVPKFEAQLAAYRQAVRDPTHFDRSITLELDPCGLELSIKRGAAVTSQTQSDSVAG